MQFKADYTETLVVYGTCVAVEEPTPVPIIILDDTGYAVDTRSNKEGDPDSDITPDIYDPAITVGSRVKVTFGYSDTIPGRSYYMEADIHNGCYGCDSDLTPETTHIGPASITGNDRLPIPDNTLVPFCLNCHPKEDLTA